MSSKTFNEIREDFKFAFRHWGQYSALQRIEKPITHMRKKGPLMLLDAFGQKQVLYESYWHTLRKQLPTTHQLAIELYYINGMDRVAVAQELCLETPETVSNYCAHSLTVLAGEIWKLQTNRRCNRCDTMSIVIDQSAATAWEPVPTCILCSRVQDDRKEPAQGNPTT